MACALMTAGACRAGEAQAGEARGQGTRGGAARRSRSRPEVRDGRGFGKQMGRRSAVTPACIRRPDGRDDKRASASHTGTGEGGGEGGGFVAHLRCRGSGAARLAGAELRRRMGTSAGGEEAATDDELRAAAAGAGGLQAASAAVRSPDPDLDRGGGRGQWGEWGVG